MITSDDLYAEDFDEEVLENVQEPNEELDDRGEGHESQAEEDKIEPKKVKPKRIIRNPQPRLNEQTLKGPRGISALPSYFERVKFKGKGYEEQDLNVLLKTYEYWCHRLFPKFPFDDCVEKIEKLGAKKPVRTHIKRIREDLDVEDRPIINNDDSDQELERATTQDPFDGLQADPVVTTEYAEITDEVAERIRINQEKAKQLRLEKLKQIQEKASSSLGESSQYQPTQDMFASQISQAFSQNGINSKVGNTRNEETTDDEKDAVLEKIDSLETALNKETEARSEIEIDDILDQINSPDDSQKSENPKQASTEDISDNVQKDMNIEDILDQINSPDDSQKSENSKQDNTEDVSDNVPNDMNIDDILDQINTPDDVSQKSENIQQTHEEKNKNASEEIAENNQTTETENDVNIDDILEEINMPDCNDKNTKEKQEGNVQKQRSEPEDGMNVDDILDEINSDET